MQTAEFGHKNLAPIQDKPDVLKWRHAALPPRAFSRSFASEKALVFCFNAFSCTTKQSPFHLKMLKSAYPVGWTQRIEKNWVKINMLKHVPIEKLSQVFRSLLQCFYFIPTIQRNCGFLSCKSLSDKRFTRAAPSGPRERRYNVFTGTQMPHQGTETKRGEAPHNRQPQ
jgi:hypothetical protein